MSDEILTYTNIIDAYSLQGLSEIIVFDCRAKLGAPGWGKSVFDEGHIPGALFLDLDQDLAAQPDHRGRHPLPEQEAWLETVRAMGVKNSDQIVIYDDASGAYAARAWWMFRWLGHEAVAVLDGGLQSWGGALETESTPRPRSDFQPRAPLTKQIDSTTVAASISELNLIDARTEARFNGEEEPIDPVAGHIPGATCLPFQGNLEGSGRFLSPAELNARFSHVADEEVDATCYCGSGVTACHNILAMHIAGLSEPQLYVDSWSGWITDPSRPIATL